MGPEDGLRNQRKGLLPFGIALFVSTQSIDCGLLRFMLCRILMPHGNMERCWRPDPHVVGKLRDNFLHFAAYAGHIRSGKHRTLRIGIRHV